VRGVFLLTQKFLPLLREHKGRIVGISSGAQIFPRPGGSAYSSAKAGLALFLQCLRLELYSSQVAVVNIAPGYIRSEPIENNEALDRMNKTLSSAKMQQSYPGFYQRRDAVLKEVSAMADKGWRTDAPGSTDDCIVEALTHPKPRFTMFTGTAMGIHMKYMAHLAFSVPESLFFRMLSRTY